MKYIDFEWDGGNEYKVIQRASLEEIESAFYDRKRRVFRTYFNRYKTIARSSSGRYLFVVYQKKAGGIIRVISVRDSEKHEIKRYWKK